MDIELVLAIAMFLSAVIALMAGFPVAFTLAGVAFWFALLGMALCLPGFLSVNLEFSYAQRILGPMSSNILLSVPLFVIMGTVLERSRVAEDLLQIASRLLRRVRGGLGYAVILVGAMLAASTGIVGATVVTLTLIALPSMMSQGYSPRLSTGAIAASGTLGQIIPPSIVLILLADAISTASQRSGVGEVVSLGDLFAGAVVPGVLLVGLYLGFIWISGRFAPDSIGRNDTIAPHTDAAPLTLTEILTGLAAPLALIVAVLGSIFFGLTTPTNAAAIGALGAILLAGLRLTQSRVFVRLIAAGFVSALGLALLGAMTNLNLDLATSGAGNTAMVLLCILLCAVLAGGFVSALIALVQAGEFRPAFGSAMQITSMIFLILIGAILFGLVFTVGFNGDDHVDALFTCMPGGLWGALALTMIVMFVLGFFLDFIEIVAIIVPLVAPPLIALGADPVWLAILMALNLQTSFLTPPFGFALFYLRGAAPDGVRTVDIWRGALPFIALQLTMIALVAALPQLATWLPSLTPDSAGG